MKLRMSWLDLKLAGRMLSKYPGLTLVGGFSFSFAIAVAAMAFEFLTQLVYPSLPVPGGDRIVALRMWDAAASRPERRALHEFMLWRDELRSVDDIGIFSVIERNLRWQDVAGAPVRGAAISEAPSVSRGFPHSSAARWSRPTKSSVRRPSSCWGTTYGAARSRPPPTLWEARFAWVESRTRWSVSCPRASRSRFPRASGFRSN